MNVTIIGGGIIGLCSAYYLQQDGYEVTVIDRNSITDGCSFGNMGFISPSHFVPLASPGIIREGLRHMLSSKSPFYIKPRLNADLLKWAYHFWKSSDMKTAIKNSIHLNNILQLSRKLIDEMRDNIGNSFSMEEKGCFMLCKSKQTLQHEFYLADEAADYGLIADKLNAKQVQELEPDVELNVAGAVLFKDDCHFNPAKMMAALKNYLEKKGVQFRLHHTVTGFEKKDKKIVSVITDKGIFKTDELVIATGSWLPKVTRMMGFNLLLQPGKGYSYTYGNIEKNIKYPAILVDGRCAISPWSQELRIGGTMELSGINNKVLINRMHGIYNSVKDCYPGLKIDFPPADKIWNGLRPVTPDGLPYIGKYSGFKNVVIAGGHAMLGISLGTGTGEIVSKLVQHKTTPINISAFKVERFG